MRRSRRSRDIGKFLYEVPKGPEISGGFRRSCIEILHRDLRQRSCEEILNRPPVGGLRMSRACIKISRRGFVKRSCREPL